MGDEFHQRNIASSALLMRALAPHIARLDHDKQHIAEVMDFLSVTDQFFLNLAMAYCKAAIDVYKRQVHRRSAIWKTRKACGKNCLTVKSTAWFPTTHHALRK